MKEVPFYLRQTTEKAKKKKSSSTFFQARTTPIVSDHTAYGYM